LPGFGAPASSRQASVVNDEIWAGVCGIANKK
jgi:hypothetical protein